MPRRNRWSEQFGPGYRRRMDAIKTTVERFGVHRAQRELEACLQDILEIREHTRILERWILDALAAEE